MKKCVSFVLLLLLCFFSFGCVTIVDGLGINSYGYTNYSYGGYGGCSSKWPCFSGIDFGYRFTLVDINGKKVPGTKSVDFTSNYSLKQQFDEGKIAHISGDNKYGYKYSFKFKDANGNPDYTVISPTDRKNDFVLQYIPSFPKNSSKNDNQFNNFMNTDFKMTYIPFDMMMYISSNPEKWKYYYKETPVTFFELFLHLSNKLPDDRTFSSLSDAEKTELRNYFVIAEATTVFWFTDRVNDKDVTNYRYGTMSELAYHSFNRTYPNSTFLSGGGRGNSWTNVSPLENPHLCVSPSDLQKIRTDLNLGQNDSFFIKNGVSSCSFENRGGFLIDLINDDYGYGVYVGSLSHVPSSTTPPPDNTTPPPPSSTSVNKFQLSSCDNDAGKITLNNAGFSNLNLEKMTDIAFKVDDNTYCYDDVSYDFSDMISDLSRKDFNKMIYVNSSPVTAEVNRFCYVKSSGMVDNSFISSIKDNMISDYKNNQIEIKLYGDTSTIISPTEIRKESIIEEVLNSNFDGQNGKFMHYNMSLTFDVPKNGLFIGNISESSYSGSISLVRWQDSFGKSSKILNGDNIVYYADKDENGKLKDGALDCHFEYGIKNPESEIRFRVISLENPFPGRDGTSRMPSKNWFYDNNYVYDYILNNRGIRSTLCGNLSEACLNSISPEKMYTTLEPMYSITLTPSTMLKIREYNKKYSYYSMYDTLDFTEGHGHENETVRQADKDADKLICDDQGRQCYSQFLRDDDYIPQTDGDLASGTGSISGKCVLVKNFKTKDDATVRMELSKYSFYNEETYPLLPLHKYIFNEETDEEINANLYDVNHNGRIDNEDYEIIFQYQTDVVASLPGRNTQYYTCANKSYFSGGPIDVGGDD